MITVIAHYKVRADDVGAVCELLARHSHASELEPGCMSFRAHQSTEDPTRFALYETYLSPQAFVEHRQTSHFEVNIEQRLVPLLLERSWRVYGPAL